jgi:hypothetical protein
MSILDAQRYAESMTRKELADVLKKGYHPLIPIHVVAAQAEDLKKSDEAVKKLEQVMGIPEPGQDIASKLAQYLESNPGRQEQNPFMPEGPSQRMAAMPGQGPGGAMPTPGVPSVPGGAGGSMPGMPRMPQGGAMTAGMPMRAAGGGLVPEYQTGGFYGEQEEEDFLGDLGDPLGVERGRSGRPLSQGYLDARASAAENIQNIGIPGMMGPAAGGKGLQLLLNLQKRGTSLVPRISQLPATIGSKLPATIRSRLPARMRGAPTSQDLQLSLNLPPGGGAGAAGGAGGAGMGSRIFDFLRRHKGKIATAGGIGGLFLGESLFGGDDEIDDDLFQEMLRGDVRSSGVSSGYQRQLAMMDDLAETASTPNAHERARQKIIEDQLKKYPGRIADVERLRPTEDQYAASRRGAGLKAISDMMAARNMGGDSRFSQIGDRIRDFDKEGTAEAKAYLDAISALEDEQAGLGATLEGELGERLRAGERFDQARLAALQSETEYQRGRDMYPASMISSVQRILKDHAEAPAMSPYSDAEIAFIRQKLMRTLQGGGIGGGMADPAILSRLAGESGDRNRWGLDNLLYGAGLSGITHKLPGAWKLVAGIPAFGQLETAVREIGDDDKYLG